MPKRIFHIALLLCAAFLISACGGGNDGLPGKNRKKSNSSYRVQSQGSPYELIVVCDQIEWDGPVGDTLRSIFFERVPMINRSEPIFDLLRVVPSGFKNLVTLHMNILIINVGPKYEKAELTVRHNVYSSPQLILVASAPNEASMVKLINENRENLVTTLEYTERERTLKAVADHGSKNMKSLILDKFGFEMNVPPGFMLRNQADDFLWMSYEMPQSSQGIVIYSYPFSGEGDFTQEALVKRRNEFVSMVPGPSDGSHMTTYDDFIELTYKKLKGRTWAETAGFWEVYNDFMGGPFINYSTVVRGNRVVSIDFYVYSPKLPQRNYKRQLEHLIYSVQMPE